MCIGGAEEGSEGGARVVGGDKWPAQHLWSRSEPLKDFPNISFSEEI